MVVLLIVSYLLGDSEPVLNAQGKVLEGGELGAASSNQWVGSLIWYSTILVLIGAYFL